MKTLSSILFNLFMFMLFTVACALAFGQTLYTVDGIALDSAELERLTAAQRMKAEQLEQTKRFLDNVVQWVSENAPTIVANSSLSEADKAQLNARMQVMQGDFLLLGRLALEQTQAVEVSSRVVRMQTLDHAAEALAEQEARAQERLDAAADQPEEAAKAQAELDKLRTQRAAAEAAAQSFRETQKLPDRGKATKVGNQ
jgi:hypothetical protein